MLNDRQHGKKEWALKQLGSKKVDSKWAFKRDGGWKRQEYDIGIGFYSINAGLLYGLWVLIEYYS